METIKIKYHSDAIDKLTYIDGKSDWIDLRAAEEVEFKAGDFKLINLGVSMKLPEGYEAHIAPRSSTFKNYGLLQVNSVGVVDKDKVLNNKEFTSELAKRLGYTTKETSELMTKLINTMSQQLEDANTISIYGFGTFEVKKKTERISVNPTSKQRLLIPPKLVLNFKPSSLLKDKFK